MIGDVLDTVVATGQPDLALRAVRMFGEGARRAADAALGVYGEAVGRLGYDLAGLPVDEQFDKQLRPWARFARQSISLAGWLSGRHLSRAIDEYSIVESERILQESGFVAERVDTPPAVAFVDLTGFTRLTEERGDDVAAAIAMRLGDVCDRHRPAAGRARGQAARRRGAHAVRRPLGGRDGDPRSPRRAAGQRAPDRARGHRERTPDQPRRRRLRAHRESRRAHRRRGARRPGLGHARGAARGPVGGGRERGWSRRPSRASDACSSTTSRGASPSSGGGAGRTAPIGRRRVPCAGCPPDPTAPGAGCSPVPRRPSWSWWRSALYVVTLMPGAAFDDWGEMQSVPHVLGVAHPTGYPTYILPRGCSSWSRWARSPGARTCCRPCASRSRSGRSPRSGRASACGRCWPRWRRWRPGPW